jgi:Fe-S-cluster containining protein
MSSKFDEDLEYYKLNVRTNEIYDMVLKEKKCKCCGLCCHISPCTWNRGDVFRVSEYLKIDKKELYTKYLTFAKLGIRDGYILNAVRVSDKEFAGNILPDTHEREFSPCILFDMERKICTIHKVKPAGGKRFGCWTSFKKTVPQTIADMRFGGEIFFKLEIEVLLDSWGVI